MKILHIGKFRFGSKGGIELLTEQLCCGLADKDHEVTFICSGKEESTKDYFFGKVFVKVFATWLKLSSAPLSPGILFYLLKNRRKFDIIHIHLPNPFVTLFILLANPKAKLVSHWHSDIIKQKKLLKIYHLFLIAFLRKQSKVVATSDVYAKESFYLKKFKEKVEIVPLGVDLISQPEGLLVEKWKSRYAGKKIVLSIGRLVYYKSFDVLIKAAGELSSDYYVVIIGSGEEEEQLKSCIDKYAPDKVDILSFVDDNDKASLLAASEIFVLPSSHKSEAYGLVQIEAMQFAKPLIACDIIGSGVSFVNKHNVSGRIVEVGDYKAIATEIEDICSDRILYKKLSEGSLKRYNNLFRLDIMIKKIENLYLDIC